MKTKVQRVRLLCLAVMLAAVAACDDEKTDDTVVVPSTKLTLEEIIAAPKATAPEDTVTLTADIRSSSPNVGDIPATKWTADGGTFLEDDKMTVRWVAPAAAGFYNVSVKATNDAGSVTAQRVLFVGNSALLVLTEAGAVKMRPNGTDFFYLRSPNLPPQTVDTGVEVFGYTGGVAADAVAPTQPTGLELVYAPDRSFEVHATNVTQPESLGIASANPRPRQIYVGDLLLGTMQRISQDLSVFDSTRRNQFAYPSVSPDGQLITYQGTVTNAGNASLDSVDVFVYRRSIPPNRIRVTGTHTNHKNYYPTFSTDQNWLTFISDRDGSNQWEIYGVPVTGVIVDSNPASVVRLTSTGGTIAPTRSGGVPGLPMRAWNPQASTLATLATDNTLYLMSTNGGGATLNPVSGLPLAILELAWSPTGSRLAVVATGKDADENPVAQIYVVTGTTAQPVHQAIPGDLLRDVVFSPDEQWMVFRNTRSGQAWLEIVDLSGGVLAGSVPITAASPAGNAAAYRDVMSLSPGWGTGNVLYFPDFLGGGSPGIRSVNVAGAVQ